MNNALVKDRLTNIESAARENSNFEKILKFKKGEYSIQEDTIPLGTEYLAHAASWTKCWIKFTDGKVEDRKVYRVALGEKPPEREDLGDLNQDEWPEGLDGKPSDPWVFQFLLPLENIDTGEVVIFVTTSIGGRTAVANLCTAYVKRAKKAPNCGQPVIKLATTEMPTRKFGKVLRPLFEVARWDDTDDIELIEPSPPTLRGDMDDEIPF